MSEEEIAKLEMDKFVLAEENRKLQKENKELKEQLASRYYYTMKARDVEIEVNNTWVNKIKEEIKELNKMEVSGEVFTTSVNFAIKILEELLKET